MDDIILPNTTESKQCRTCKKWFPATPEYFHRNKSNNSGIQTACKTCTNAAINAPREIIPPAPGSQKQCTKCEEWLPSTAQFFHRDKQKIDGLCSKCKSCVKKQHEPYYAHPENKEHQKSYNKTYNLRVRQTPQSRKKQKAYRDNSEVRKHREYYGRTYYINNRESIVAKQKIYNERPSVMKMAQLRGRASSARRRARKNGVRGMYTVFQIQEQLKRQKYRCYYAACGRSKLEKRNGRYMYHIDHTFPISRVAGTDIPANDISYLVLTCPSCNLRKKDKFPWEWVEGGRLL